MGLHTLLVSACVSLSALPLSALCCYLPFLSFHYFLCNPSCSLSFSLSCSQLRHFHSLPFSPLFSLPHPFFLSLCHFTLPPFSLSITRSPYNLPLPILLHFFFFSSSPSSSVLFHSPIRPPSSNSLTSLLLSPLPPLRSLLCYHVHTLEVTTSPYPPLPPPLLSTTPSESLHTRMRRRVMTFHPPPPFPLPLEKFSRQVFLLSLCWRRSGYSGLCANHCSTLTSILWVLSFLFA